MAGTQSQQPCLRPPCCSSRSGRCSPRRLLPLSPHRPTRMCPIFQISNVMKQNLNLLKMFLNLLSSHQLPEEEPAEFQIDDTYSGPGACISVS